MVEKLAGYVFGHSGQSGALTEGIMGSDYLVPAMLSMYLEFSIDRFVSKDPFTAADKAALKAWVDAMLDFAQKLGVLSGELAGQIQSLGDDLTEDEAIGKLVQDSKALSAYLFKQVLSDGLTAAGLPEEDGNLYNELTSDEYCGALSHALGYFLLYDDAQTEFLDGGEDLPTGANEVNYMNQQLKHLATLIGNFGSYQRPHNNEVILSWFRTIDPSYADFQKETASQLAGYRRVYAEDMDQISGSVEDENGNVVARFRNGKITERSDKWIGITTCDNGDWLRLPLENAYTVNLKSEDGEPISLRLSEYRVYDNTEVKIVTNDSQSAWNAFTLADDQSVVLTVPAVGTLVETYGLGDNGSGVEYSATVADEEMEIRITGFTPSADVDGAFDLTFEATKGIDPFVMSVDTFEECIFAGTSVTNITERATIVERPAQDGASLTFTVKSPDETAAASFFRIKAGE